MGMAATTTGPPRRDPAPLRHAGGTDDSCDTEPVLQAVEAFLARIQLCTYYAVPGISDLHFTLFRADGAEHLGEPTDPSEAVRVEWVPISNLRKLIDEGQITDGASLMALSFALAFPPAESP